MDKVHKPNSINTNTPLSESYRGDKIYHLTSAVNHAIEQYLL